MELWAIILICILIVSIIVMVITTFFYQRSNTYATQQNTLLPFSSAIQPGQSTSTLLNSTGGSQIDCSSVGGKINIVAAWTETIDPFNTCVSSPLTPSPGTSSGSLNLTCGLKGPKIPCKQDGDCGTGMSCLGGICSPAVCPMDKTLPALYDPTKCSCGGNYCPIIPGTSCDPTNAKSCNDPNQTVMSCQQTGNNGQNGTASYQCVVNSGSTCNAPDQYTGQFCSSYPLCSHVSTTVVNKPNIPLQSVVNNMCNAQGVCRPRDSSAYLASLCDGKTTCNVTFDPSNKDSGFGPMPCAGNLPGSIGYNDLPITPGSNGNYSQGYYVHGLYTCILPS